MNKLKQELITKLNNTDIKLVGIINKLNTVELSTDDIEIILLCNTANKITIRCTYRLTVVSVRVSLSKTHALTAYSFNDVARVIDIINAITR